MIHRLEILPNEIFVIILSYITWFEMIESFGSLNKRFNNLIYLKFSMNKNGIVISKRCLSFNRCHSIITSKINNISSVFDCIKWIHIDGTNSNCCDIISHWIFHSKIVRFINLKKLILTKCYLTEKLIENLSLLIQYQLNALVLSFDQDMFESNNSQRMSRITCFNQKSKLMLMFKEFLRKLFSVKSKLIYLELDISNDDSYVNIHQYFSLSSNLINNEFVTNCMSIRCLYIHLIYGYIIENIIKYVPTLEILSIQFKNSLIKEPSYEIEMKKFRPTIVNWYNKIPKLKSFILKSVISDDFQLNYLRWIINKVNYIEKLKLHLDIKNIMNDNCVINENFLEKYCMPNILVYLIDFDFYIVSKCKLLLLNDIQKIIDSFKSHQFFANGQWKNIKCSFDPIMSCQHISSKTTIIKPKCYDLHRP
ncbi:unnamed protein product [Rotaria sp. Silwood2]|nr:unnamed protein product [Rotaria sp. Silwood2]CAF4509784.1 unnamed protein product [Rotaria sp. Silwood2]